jgi:RNA polymerase sigma-70 factor (ECF subfamily)
MADSSSDERLTRPSLLLRLRDPRDADAWQAFVDVYGPLIYGHSRRQGLGHEDAEDVVQRVLARVASAIGRFEYRPERGQFRRWLGTIVRNEARTVRARRNRLRGDGHAVEEVEAQPRDSVWNEEFNDHVLRVALQRCRPRFEEDTWRAFERTWIDDAPPAAVATELGRPVGWVYVAKSRVLRQLWIEVRELADDSPWLAALET